METKKIVVFDLNKTFYTKSSKDEFYKFIWSKRPKRLMYYFEMAYYILLLKLHAINQTEFKENFFNYLDGLTPEQVHKYATEFWDREFPAGFNNELRKRLDEWQKKNVDVVCATGGLELYVKPLFAKYGITTYVGTRAEYVNGTYKLIGEACKQEEKICRVDEYYKGQPYEIIEAYSDSKEKILEKAAKAFLIKDGKIIPYHPKKKD